MTNKYILVVFRHVWTCSKKLLNDEGEFTKREIVNGTKKLFIGPRNKSSIVVSSSSRSGQQKTITKIIGFQATIYRVSSFRFSCRSMRKSSSSVRWFWCSFSSCRVCKAWNSESKSKLVVTVASGCKFSKYFVKIETLQLQNYRILSFWFSCRRQPQ